MKQIEHGDIITVKDLYLAAYGFIDGDAKFISWHRNGKAAIIETEGGIMNVDRDRVVVNDKKGC